MPTAYKIEPAPDRRAGCLEKACKEQKIKFDKGEIRYGTWVEMAGTGFESASWRFKHWGCVTPKQLENLKKFLDGDMALLEGFDELDADWQEKVKRALDQGHIDDEDWRGEIEFNRPGKTGMRSRKKKVVSETEESGRESPATPSPKAKGKKRGRPKKEEASNDGDEAYEVPAKKKAKTKSKIKVKVKDEESNDEDGDYAVTTKTKQKKKQTKSKSKAKVKAETDSDDEEEVIPVKTERKSRVKAEPTSDDDIQVVVESKRKSRAKIEPTSDDDQVFAVADSKTKKKGRGRPKKEVAPKPRGPGRPKMTDVTTADNMDESVEDRVAKKETTEKAVPKSRSRGRPKKEIALPSAANTQETDEEVQVDEDAGDNGIADAPEPKTKSRGAGRGRGRRAAK